MKTNILRAFLQLRLNATRDLAGYSAKSGNRMNSVGEALEQYVRDLFCGSDLPNDPEKRDELYTQLFSYLGNQHNPPDLMIRGGDAVEIKQVRSQSRIALNSSYPKDKLHAESPMISEACRNAEEWDVKDVVHIVGRVEQENVQAIWFVHGPCYAADRTVYERIKQTISEGISEMPHVEFAETNELGRVNRVDPLGFTHLRIRGMWEIESPDRVFASVLSEPPPHSFMATAVMLKSKYESFPNEDRAALEAQTNKSFTITDIQIKSPNNPAKMLSAICLRYIQK